MTVYAVIAGIEYEGETFSSLRLFSSKASAEAYAEDLKVEMGSDYVLIEEREVC